MNKSVELHKKLKGKIETKIKKDIKTSEDMSLLYSPGVVEPCIQIQHDKDKIYEYTIKNNTIAIITNGTAVLGLGDIGVEASLPVMEGKSLLLKKFSGVNSFPICINEKDPNKLVEIIKKIDTTFGAINLEDISAPDCFLVEKRLQNELNIPVFHDDQHGTSIVVAAALINSCKILKKNIKDLIVCQSGTGAAGLNIIKTIKKMGVKKIYAYNINGVVNSVSSSLNDSYTNQLLTDGYLEDNNFKTLDEIFKGSDLFIGVSAKDIVSKEMINSMNEDPIVFALANPDPEISYNEIKETKYGIYGTGRSDLPNQINNCLAFPGVLKGLLESNKLTVDENLKIRVAIAISKVIKDNELNRQNILPSIFNKSVVKNIVKEMKKIK